MTVFLLFLYFAKVNMMNVPDWLMNVTWALTAGSWIIKLLAALAKIDKKE